MEERQRQRARVGAIIAERFQTSSMSDAKWVRLLDTLTAHPGLVHECRAKLVWDDEVRELRIDEMEFQFDYWPHAMEAMISGRPRGWYEYRELEWILFPVGKQDVARIRSVLDARGRFDLEEGDDGLRLYAYR